METKGTFPIFDGKQNRLSVRREAGLLFASCQTMQLDVFNDYPSGYEPAVRP
jgi:hypothetical protein